MDDEWEAAVKAEMFALGVDVICDEDPRSAVGRLIEAARAEIARSCTVVVRGLMGVGFVPPAKH